MNSPFLDGVLGGCDDPAGSGCEQQGDSLMKLRHLILPALSILAFPACEDDPDGMGADGGTDAAVGTPDGSAGGDVGLSDVPAVVGNCTTLVTTSALAETVSTDQVLSGAIAVTGRVSINAAKITIQPGTTFVMGSDASIEFGWNSNVASLFARGTAAQPIRFCGRQATPGFWEGITVGNKITSDSVLENVVITDAGQKTGAALELNGPVLIKDVLVAGSGAEGVQAMDFKDGSTGLSVTGAAKAPVALLGHGAATRFPLGGRFTGNGNNVIAVRFEDTDDADTTFKDATIPYLQEATVRIMAPVKVVFEPGVEYRMAVDTILEIGWNSNASSIIANGTAAKPIKFTNASATAGMWKSILIGSKVRSDSVLNYVTISGGGNGAPALDVHAAITLKNLTLDGNMRGLEVDGGGLGATSTALTITRTMGPPVVVDLLNATTLPMGTYTGNTNDWIVIKGGDIVVPGTLANLGVPYRIEGTAQANGNSTLTIAPGTTFLMGPDAELEIGWNSSPAKILAVGTAMAPIVFKGAEDVPGYWNGLTIGTMVAASSKLAYVQISNGGKATPPGGGLDLMRMPFDVSNSKFSKSAGFGIKKVLGDTTDYAAPALGNTFEMNGLGPVGPL